MPTYSYKCSKGHVFEKFMSFSECGEPQICDCGADSARYFPPDSAPSFIVKGFDAYESPASGKIISNAKQRREDFAETGCMEYDPEIKTDQKRNIEEGDRAIDKAVDETVDREFAKMTTEQKEMIAKDMATTKEEYTRIGDT